MFWLNGKIFSGKRISNTISVDLQISLFCGAYCKLLNKQALRVRRKNCELLENYHKAHEQGESWEAKCHEVETGFSCYTGTGQCRV